MENKVLNMNDVICTCGMKQIECIDRKEEKIKDGLSQWIIKLKGCIPKSSRGAESFFMELEDHKMRVLKEEAFTRFRF